MTTKIGNRDRINEKRSGTMKYLIGYKLVPYCFIVSILRLIFILELALIIKGIQDYYR